MEKTILFDTGTNGDTLLYNIDRLKVDLNKVRLLFLSHIHGDPIGGIRSVVSRNPDISAFVPISFPDDIGIRTGIKTIFRLDQPTEICKDVFSTGEMGRQIKEQSLLLNTKRGLVIITGCSHPGILEIVKKAKEIINKDIYLVLGGFHLLQHSDTAMKEIVNEFKRLGVLKCGATHCTGEKQIQIFKETYGNNYIEMGTGRIMIITDQEVELH